MKPLSFLAFAISVLSASSALAERFGSETSVTVQGVYYQAGETVTTTLPNGDVHSTATRTTVRVNNRTILEAMRDRDLITDISGYRLVMVAHGHMADGILWFATKNGGVPVAVPSDLLSLDVTDGPANGQWVVSADAVLKSMRQQTVNQTSLSLAGGFAGTGLLNQAWTARSIKDDDFTEVVELVSSSGSFTGVINGSPTAGVGTVQFTLANPKVVVLTRYIPAPMISSGGTLDSGGTIYTAGSAASATSINLSSSIGIFTIYNQPLTVSSGTLTLGGTQTFSGNITVTGGTLNVTNATLSSTSTLTINTTTGGTVTGLIVDADGNVTQFPTFGSSLPGTLIIITSSGTHTYTHDSNGVWTLVTS